MATLHPGTPVVLAPGEASTLVWLPPPEASLYVAVHAGALKAGAANSLTQVVGLTGADLVWAGAIDEKMVIKAEGGIPLPQARVILGHSLLKGPRLWHVIRPGLLTTHGTSRPYLTVYDNERPWVVLGESADGAALAAPLNDIRGNPKWFTPRVDGEDLLFAGSKGSQVELAHLWSFGNPPPAVGQIAPRAREPLSKAIREYVR